MLDAADVHAPKPHQAFGRWLLGQAARSDLVGELAKAAQHDSRFPRDGSPRAVSAHLNTLGADPDMHAALDDAELDWRCH